MRQTIRFATVHVVLSLLATAAWAQQRPLTLGDYGDWNRITQVELSGDGSWMAFAHQPNDGDATLHVKRIVDGRPEATLFDAMNGTEVRFSDDNKWVAFLSSPSEKEADTLREEKKPVPQTLHVIELSSGEETTTIGVRGFAFSKHGRFLAIHRDRSDGEADHSGSDLLLRDLAEGTTLSFGNVSEYEFSESGSFLAYVVDAEGKTGNGLYAVTAADGRIRPLSTGPDRFEGLAWSEAHADLSVLRGEQPDGMTRRANTLVVATGLDSSAPDVALFDPAADRAFPPGMVISELAGTSWTEDGARVVLGLKEQENQEPDEEAEDEDEPNVDVWHWADDRLQSVQMAQAERDRRHTYMSVFNVVSGGLIRLGDEQTPDVDIPDRGQWATGRRPLDYRDDLTEAGGRFDYVRIDLDTGDDDPIGQDIRRVVGTSPDGLWFVYAKNEVLYSVNLETLTTTNLTEPGVDFFNQEFDLVAERPLYGVAGWTESGEVLLNTRWDVWSVPLGGGSGTNLTAGAGERDQRRYRVVDLDPESDWTDIRGMVLSGYGEWTKQSGYFRARPGEAPEALLFGDEMILDLRKAKDADRVVFTRQTFEQFPDYWTSDLSFRNPSQVTDANPQLAEFAWGRRVLVDYTDERGNELQATLTLPADYEEGHRYPMVVYFYEKMSQRHHQFSQPVYDDRPHMSTYASNGYLVLMPDIVYDDGYPGSSALDDVTAATKRVIELGYADPDRVGLQGHSWGGYETSFILTQTDMFATIVTGAPLTNLMSMNNILYKRTGNQNGPILEWSQGRMGDQPWDDFERWVSQSPVHQAPSISTPFLILHGTEDGAVDWNQGLELYTAARRLGKEVILLSYPDEPHHLTKEANQKDFQIRMKQYFDHFLMDAEAPAWLVDGVPFLDKGKKADRRTVS